MRLFCPYFTSRLATHSRPVRESPARDGFLADPVGVGGVDADQMAAAVRTSSQRQSSLAFGLVLGDSQTSEPGSASPIIEPGLAQWATIVLAGLQLDIGQEALVAAQQAAAGQGDGEFHSPRLETPGRHIKPSPWFSLHSGLASSITLSRSIGGMSSWSLATAFILSPGAASIPAA